MLKNSRKTKITLGFIFVLLVASGIYFISYKHKSDKVENAVSAKQVSDLIGEADCHKTINELGSSSINEQKAKESLYMLETRAWCYLTTGDYDNAQQDYETAQMIYQNQKDPDGAKRMSARITEVKIFREGSKNNNASRVKSGLTPEAEALIEKESRAE